MIEYWKEIVEVLAFLGVIFGAWWANRPGNARIASQKGMDYASTLDTVNTSIERAYKRADAAEAHLELVEQELEETRQARIADKKEADRICKETKEAHLRLETEFHEWKKQRFMIAFTMLFSDEDPRIEKVAAYRDRRAKDAPPFEGNDRRQKV